MQLFLLKQVAFWTLRSPSGDPSNPWSTWCPQHSYREVGILLLYLAVGVSVFSGFAYTAEYEEVGSVPSGSLRLTFAKAPHSPFRSCSAF